ncbi:hypothetical protein ACO2RV_03965 [Ancylobacter sp. VNQ12]|uniref:hypothetical protein n=1 Tax=Ancylobacter sp. VNQ12 TaxID=3400920 RepID=UPI003C000279
MFDTIGKPFFAALATCAEGQLSSEHACTRALRQAAASGAREDIAVAEAALRALPESAREALMAAGHRTLRENPASLLGSLAPMAPRGRLH